MKTQYTTMNKPSKRMFIKQTATPPPHPTPPTHRQRLQKAHKGMACQGPPPRRTHRAVYFSYCPVSNHWPEKRLLHTSCSALLFHGFPPMLQHKKIDRLLEVTPRQPFYQFARGKLVLAYFSAHFHFTSSLLSIVRVP